ncbi:stress response translation initiation inhibitor YciH [bacterium SCSIO 12696]|nr:stress response translation initiation inhibitor YciH [bacterium SCSIO 12696]
MSKNSRLVYSTDQGRIKPPQEDVADRPSGDGVVRLSRETKGRKGKGVTLVTGLNLPEPQMKQLAKRLKQLCGAGGALKNGVIELQTDNREKIKAELEKQGHNVKIAGG